MDPEAAFAKGFITSEKRARFIQYLADPRRRKEMLARLDAALPYLPEFATEVAGEQDYPEELEKLLLAKGAGPTCYLIAHGLKADRSTLLLRDALDRICLHPLGAILCCVPGQLAYYRPAAPAAGLLLERHPG